ncbi:hypothetical protein PENTCL1PPCAC_29177, partial [Pristionchus entomophagus]
FVSEFVHKLNNEVNLNPGTGLTTIDATKFEFLQAPSPSLHFVPRLHAAPLSIRTKGISFADRQRAKHAIISRVHHKCLVACNELIRMQYMQISRMEREKWMAERGLPAFTQTRVDNEFLTAMAQKWSTVLKSVQEI